MGIRFKCPNGHKLNVKAFLAGKRGICPHCGVKVDIPLPPDVQTAGAAPGNDAAALLAASPGKQPGSLAGQPTNGHPAHKSATAVAPAATPAASPHPVPAASPETAGRFNYLATADPIAEAPGALWYVRPRTGGQFGPATGEWMRRWIDEGRVAGDSMVWREGWTDWRSAAGVFDQLRGAHASEPGCLPGEAASNVAPASQFVPVASAAPAPRPTTPAVFNDSAAAGSLDVRPAQPKSSPAPAPTRFASRRRSNATLLTMIFLLAMTVLILLPVLIWVLVKTS